MEGPSNYVIVMNQPQMETLTELLTTNGFTLTQDKIIEIAESSQYCKTLQVETKNKYNENLLVSRDLIKKRFSKDNRNQLKMKNSKVPSVLPSVKNNLKCAENNRTSDRNNYISTTFADLARQLSEAASEGNHEEVSKLIANGASVHAFGPVYMNPLHLAALNGHVKVCGILLNSGVFINASNKLGKTALHLASVGGHTKVVKFLLSSGAIVDAIDMLEMTPLHWACDRGHSSVVKLLLQRNADPNRCNKFGKSPLQLAIEKNFVNIINLMEKGTQEIADEEMSSGSDVKEEILDLSFEDFNDHSFSIQEVTESERSFEEIALQDSQNAFKDLPEVFNEEFTPEVLNEEEVEAEEIEDFPDEDSHNILSEDEEQNDSSSDYADYEDRKQDSLLNSIAEMHSAALKTNSHKLVKDYEDCLNEATALLRAQTALISLEDPSQMLQRAITYGHTIQLTEAGERALAMIKPEPLILPSQSKQTEKEDDDVRKPATNGRTNVASSAQSHNPCSSSNPCNALVLRNETKADFLIQPATAMPLKAISTTKNVEHFLGQWKTTTEPPVKRYKT